MGMAKPILWPWAEIMELMPNNHLAFSRIRTPKMPGAVTFHALTAIWRLPSLFLEEDKMGMIAF
jgi:hypothetical protein